MNNIFNKDSHGKGSIVQLIAAKNSLYRLDIILFASV